MNCLREWTSHRIKFLISSLILSFLVVKPAIYAQTIQINYINTDNFPVIEAGFSATTPEGSKIYNSSVSDFLISENNKNNKVIEVINPQQIYQPVSIVLMIDISMSMHGSRISLVKEGLADFVDLIPLETSEIAIAAFSDETYIYTDFTQSRSRII
ncbi:MAG: VWA domain-containing protein, partial [Bacteroidales bacterium]|nr:VWA domain-containing protein [Bacteroidales bacterium]